MENNGRNIETVALELVQTKRKIDEFKSIYEKMDNLTLELKASMDENNLREVAVTDPTILETFVVNVNDNFSTKNVAFRQAAVRRFEAEVVTLTEREQKLAKAAKKSAKDSIKE